MADGHHNTIANKRRKFYDLGRQMAFLACTVTIGMTDRQRTVHVHAETVNEAVVHAMKQLLEATRHQRSPRRHERVQVLVAGRARPYQTTVGAVLRWLYGTGGSSEERQRKVRLRFLLDGDRH